MSQNIWIVTIGSSDVQLRDFKAISYENLWSSEWYPEIEHKLHGNSDAFQPSETKQITWGDTGEESEKTTYRLPARVLGLAYNALSEQVGKYLIFPLLDRFISQLKEEQVVPTTIVVLLTDQEQFFSELDKKRDFCPYWQDTCWLKEALTDCFFSNEDNGLKGVKLEWIVLSPKNKEGKDDKKYGLDHWDKVLSLVTNELKEFKKVNKIELKPGDRVYVSHQAGTPAISSAVQFACLAEFKKQFQVEGKPPQQTVRFLVSNEYGSPTKPIESSEYLRGIRKQEALALLERHDYSGIKALVSHYLNPCEQILLDAAIQWNYAEFGKFSDLLKGRSISEKYPDLAKKVEDRTEEKNWWWTAYEAAYLALVRFRQGNTVEAIFHSFRAVEGLLRNWVDEYYLAKPLEGNDPRKYIHSKDRSPITRPNGKKFQAFGKHLYWFINQDTSILKNEKMRNHITVFGEQVFDRRNELFHQLKGLHQLEKLSVGETLEEKEAAVQFWEITSNNEKDWMERVIGCLNFVANQNFNFLDFDQQDDKEKPSLMVKVHQGLKSAIDTL